MGPSGYRGQRGWVDGEEFRDIVWKGSWKASLAKLAVERPVAVIVHLVTVQAALRGSITMQLISLVEARDRLVK